MFRVLFFAYVGLAVLTGVAHSAVLSVGPKASGAFGSSGGGQSSGDPMVAFAVADGVTYEITATGSFFLDGSNVFFIPSPNGVTITAAGEITSLEERDGVDSNENLLLGALLGAFVLPGTPGTSGIDEDFGGNVAAASLFLIGAGPFLFNAPDAGTLYLGVNESFAGNNRGDGFLVTIVETQVTAMPEPSTLALLGMGFAVVVARRRRRAATRR